jgi:uncharacterized protein HemX
MDGIAQRLAALRTEIDVLKAALPSVFDETQRQRVYNRLNQCLSESLKLVSERAQNQAGDAAVASQTSGSERRVGENLKLPFDE